MVDVDAAGEHTGIPATNYWGPGTPAEHRYGVLYQAEWETPWDGTAVAARLHARSLAAQGLPVLLKSFSGVVVNSEGVPQPVFAVGLPDAVKAEVQGLHETSIETLAMMVKHMVVRGKGALDGYLMPRHVVHEDPTVLLALRRAVYDSTVTYTVWERDRVSPEIAALLGRCAQAWVPCRQNAAALIRSGVPGEKVHVVPHPYDPTDSICRLVDRRPFPDRKRFYSIGRWEPRKGYRELLFAFMEAFRPGDAADLTIKTSPGTWTDYPGPDETVAEALKRYDYWTGAKLRDHVSVDARRYPRSRILKLHFDHNIYVSSSHGEAHGLPAFEAKLAGNRLVHVPFGGTADFCDTEDVALAFDLEPVPRIYGWEPDAQWASVDVSALAAALVKARAPEVFVRPSHYERVFGFEAVGRKMADLILGQLDAVDPKAAAWLRERAP
jgi:glycosyltransferase involved in cell wall biosynthesis